MKSNLALSSKDAEQNLDLLPNESFTSSPLLTAQGEYKPQQSPVPQDSNGVAQTTAGSPFAIHLDFFSGPMDLLLHLVRQKEVSIEQVEMSDIAEQYLRIVLHSGVWNLEAASEYLVIAATLLAIKSRSLLPDGLKEEDVVLQEQTEEFYEELRARLRRYEATQRLAKDLVSRNQLDVNIFIRKDKTAVRATASDLEEGQDSLNLAQHFLRLLKRVGMGTQSFFIRLESISIVSFMVRTVDGLKGLVAANKPMDLRSLLRSFYLEELKKGVAQTPAMRRGVVIGSVISLLELAKRGVVRWETATEGLDSVLSLQLEDDNDFVGLDDPADDKLVSIADYRERVSEKEFEGIDNHKDSSADAGGKEVDLLGSGNG